MPDRITVNNFIPTLRDLGFLILVAIVDLAVIISTIYLEANGAKLALPNFTWPKEVSALLTLLGIPPSYLSPPVVLGFSTTMLIFIGTFLIVHYFIGTIGTAQRFIINRNREDLYPLIQPLIIAVIVASLLYGVLFRMVMMPWAQLQLAKTFWPMDFQTVLKGDAILAIKQAIPDLNIIIKRHEGEFLNGIVTNFPFGLLAMHLLASLLTEIFFLHTMMNLGKFDARINEVVGRARGRFLGLSQGIRRFWNRREESNPMEAPRQAGLTPTPVTEDTTRREGGNTGSENYPTLSTETPEQGTEAEPLSPADQPVRVIGGGDTITPNMARQYPDLYVVEERRDPETGEVSYLIYTREFYEKMNNHVEVLR